MTCRVSVVRELPPEPHRINLEQPRELEGRLWAKMATAFAGTTVGGRSAQIPGLGRAWPIEVTGQQRPSEALRESEARKEALLSSLDDLVFELDESGTYLGIWTTNDALLSAPRAELLGRTVRETLGDEIGSRLIGVIDHVLDTGVPEIWEFSLDVPAGARSFQSRVAPIAGSEGSLRSVCLLVRDTTEQEVAEREISRLLSREQLLSRLSEVVPVGLFEIDLAGHINFSNDRARTMLGELSTDTVETLMSSVVAVQDRPTLRSGLIAVFAGQPVDDLEMKIRQAPTGVHLIHGTEKVFSLSMRPLKDAAGLTTGAVGCLSDVTDRALLHRELELKASVDMLTSCLNRGNCSGLLSPSTPRVEGARIVGNSD